jgi:hypothetical protein
MIGVRTQESANSTGSFVLGTNPYVFYYGHQSDGLSLDGKNEESFISSYVMNSEWETAPNVYLHFLCVATAIQSVQRKLN